MMKNLLTLTALILCGCHATESGRGLPADTDLGASHIGRHAVTDSDAPPLGMYPRNYAPEGARVFIVTPADGTTVRSPVRLEFGSANVSIVRAGDPAPDSGHHHLVVDAALPDERFPIPADDHYLHFDDGSTSASVELAPGEHTLALILGDHLHIPHLPPVHSQEITITVLR